MPQTAPTLDDIAALGDAALMLLPEHLKRHLGTVALQVMEFPDDEMLDAVGLESPFDLLGLYQGVDIGRKETGFVPTDIDRIFLFRRPILDEWCDGGEDLAHLVRHVVIHEIGHHLGLSDDDMARIERDADAGVPSGF